MYYKTPFGFLGKAVGNVWLFQNQKRKYFSLFLINMVILFSLAFMNEIVIIYMNISNYFSHFRMVHDPEKFIFTNNPD